MLKSIAHPLICIMLIFSILAPSIAPLVDKECAVAMLMDTNDEEKSKDKEAEKKIGEKDLFSGPFSMDGDFFLQLANAENPDYLFLNSDFMVEILLPPPEKLA
ncbi:hypothetical protein [Flagellimonas sp. 2504JD4-2]